MAKRLTEEEKALRLISEATFQQSVQKMMRQRGWRWYHAPDNKPKRGFIQNIVSGFPDLIAVRGDRLLFAELKRETGKTSENQDEWLEELAYAGAETYVWRPSDMAEIALTLL